MNKPNKCKNCQWYGKPYWSIINPCDNCPNENDYKTIIKIDGDPVFKETITEEQLKTMEGKSIFEITIKEKDKEIERLNNIVNELEKVLDRNIELNYYKNNVRQYNKTLTEGAIMYRDYIKEKLQELKGGK